MKKLEKDDAEYWKVLKQIEPFFQMMESFDEVLSNEGIQAVMQTTMKEELNHPASDLDENLLRELYINESLPLELEGLFRDE